MAEVKSDEISAILRKQLSGFETEVDIYDVGTVLYVGDGVARVYGLSKCEAGELIEFPNGVFGIALNLEEDNVGCILFGESSLVKEGDLVKRTGRIASMPVGEAMLGRVINPLGQPIDGKGEIHTDKFLPLERKALGVIQRQPVKEPLQTGVKAVDAMIPIGRGQRELIIGQKGSTVAQVVKNLQDAGAMEFSTVICATASDPAPMQYIAAFAGATLGEYFRDSGRHALVIYDDLSKQAASYREVSLLLRRPPGREAYPGDVFYLHSRLLERASKLSDELGGGSLTALPIIETQAGDVSAYIPTNVISITDGQIYLEPNLFNSGVRPAINVGISVSRVGGNAQIKAMKKIAGTLRLDLAQYRELEAFAKFGSDLDKATMQQLKRGERLVEILKQKQYSPMTVEDQVLIIFAATKGYLDEIPVNQVSRYQSDFIQEVENMHPDIVKSIADTKDLTKENTEKMESVLKDFTERFKSTLK